MLLSVHSSPLAKPGVQDTGGMNVYILNLGYEWCKRGIYVDIYTRSQDPSLPRITHFTPGGRVIRIQAGPEAQIPKDTLYDYMPAFSAGVIEQVAEEAIHYDIIYSHYWLSGLVALDLRTAWNIPIAAMFHTLGKGEKSSITAGRYTGTTTPSRRRKNRDGCGRLTRRTNSARTTLHDGAIRSGKT